MANTNEETDNKKKDLFKSYHGGPKGFGDPESTQIRKAESYIFVTQIVKDRAHVEKCQEEVKKWGECMETSTYGSFITCRNQILNMNSCLARWYTDKEFRQECEQIYLEKRKKFRETGIIEKEPPQTYYKKPRPPGI